MEKGRIAVKKFTTMLLTVGAALGGTSALLATVNAICRKFFSLSLPWAEELCTYAVVVAFFLAIPYLELTDSHLSIEILENIIKSKRIKKILFILKGILVTALCVIIVRYGIAATMAAHTSNTLTYVLKWPRSLFFGITVASFILSIVSWLSIYLLNKGDKFDD